MERKIEKKKKNRIKKFKYLLYISNYSVYRCFNKQLIFNTLFINYKEISSKNNK